MERHSLKKIMSLLLTAALCWGVFAPAAVGAADMPESQIDTEMTDGAAFGEWMSGEGELAAETMAAWTNDAMAADKMKTLLNGLTLTPQKTGWKQLDELIEGMLKNAGSDTYSKLWYMYDWLVKSVSYSWEGYSNTAASVASYNSVTGYNYLKSMAHDGQPKTIPDDMANRTYHILTAKRGVCYDYAIAFAVIARYVGIESYVHTGIFTFEDTSNGAGHHGWTVLVLNGKNYIFDPQRDARNFQYHSKTGYYFGVANGWRYRSDSANTARDASLLPLSYGYTVQAVASRSGTVSGAGKIPLRTAVALTAVPASTKTFAGWYDTEGKLLSKELSYGWTPTADRTVYALFDGDVFVDLKSTDWFLADAMEAAEKGLVNGITPVTFEGDRPFTRAMMVTMLARLDKVDTAKYPASGFTDCKEDWYIGAVNWAKASGIVKGKDDGTYFAPQDAITREEFISMVVRYMETYKGYQLTAKDLSYPDAKDIEPYALDAVKKAQTMELIEGYEDKTLRPKSTLVRREGAAILMRLSRYLEKNPLKPEEPETPSPEPSQPVTPSPQPTEPQPPVTEQPAA